MKVLSVILVGVLANFASYAAEIEHVVSVESAKPAGLGDFTEAMEKFTGAEGYFSSKYFQNKGEGCDFSEIKDSLRDTESARNVLKSITGILAEINQSHTTLPDEIIQLHYNDKKYDFVGKSFQEWSYLTQIQYKILARELRFL